LDDGIVNECGAIGGLRIGRDTEILVHYKFHIT
jgi:hypothetical protein